LGEPARRLLPLSPANRQGGAASFTMKVDPQKLNYFTVKLWGGDVTQNRLILFVEGKQVGYRHLGDVDILDPGTESDAPPLLGRFYYTTNPLPLALTQGKTELHCEIRSFGRIWGYCTTFEQFQKTLTDPTRGIYGVFTHTDGFFAPPSDALQGMMPRNAPTRQMPGPEVLDTLKARVSGEVNNLLKFNSPLNQMQTLFLAQAYGVTWTSAYQKPEAVARILASLDATFAAYRANPKLAQSDPATPNADWFGLGPSGNTLMLMAPALKSRLDETISDGTGGQITRRAAFSEMLLACRDWHRENRRQYTNQSMINDLYGIYLANRGLRVVDPAKALPEKDALRYLYESVGLEPWWGSEKNGVPTKPLGDHYYQLTAQGLTKELGFVGYYGEVLDWVTTIYNATRPAPGEPGDPKIRAQLVKIAHARTPLRYPALDADGNRAMRAETLVGWRDEGHYPGDVTYAERPSWDGSTVYVAAATLDPVLVGAAQQMFADNQFFSSLRDQMQETGFRSTAGLLETPDQYALLQAHPPSPRHLPMAPGQPDFVWSDAEDGVLALKRGDEMLYVSLYWRARNAINFRARVHQITLQFDRIAVVHEDEQFTPSGLMFTQPDEINGQGLPWLPHYPGDLHSAQAGEELPIAKIPAGIAFKPGEENAYAGRAEFYTLRYGPYLIGMNSTPGKTFALPISAGVTKAQNLVSGKTVTLTKPLTVGPMSTVVLYMGK
ncbi:MAG: hypothetical protein M3Y28_10390, partial [Armatimonadota bacterium]|nr:hypothetical protein [Armatimonadota bacterium]